MYHPNRTPAPATPILGDNYGHASDPGQQWKLVSTVYNAALNVVVVAAVAAIFTVKAGILPVGDNEAQLIWVEVASQVVNGVFTAVAMTNQPYYIVHLVMTSRVLKTSGEQSDKITKQSIRAARYMSKHFPLVFVHRGAIRDNDADRFEAQRSDDSAKTVIKSPAKTKEVSRLGNLLFLRDDVKHLRKTFVILNCGCLFQYLMTAYMWSYGASSRPGFVLPALLPPTALCNVGGQFRLKRLSKRGEGRQMVMADGVPVFRELSVTRNSQSSL